MSDSFEHLTNAFGKFIKAGFIAAEAKFGLVGYWLGPTRLLNKFDTPIGNARERMLVASDAWRAHYPGLEDPYADLVQFLDGGGDIGRWENNVLDVTFPNGEMWGVPLGTFESVASGSLSLPQRDAPDRSDCPTCGSTKVARLVYGLVDMDKIDGELASGRAVLAGCDVSESSPHWHCTACGTEWGITEWASILAARRAREAAALAKREAEVLQRGVLEAVLRPTGLVRCPHCRRSFDTKSAASWDGTKHLSCGTYLVLKRSEADS